MTSKPAGAGGLEKQRGIGLALVRLVTTQHGGHVEITDGPMAVPRSWCGWLMRDVLIVDDDFMVAEIHRRFVDRIDGFQAAGVARTGGAEALSAAETLSQI